MCRKASKEVSIFILFLRCLYSQPDLVPLFSGERDTKLSEKLHKRALSDLSSPLPQQLPVLGSKQFVIGDVWVMCVKLVNNRGRFEFQ
jgi:hypothetical protein